MNWTSGMVYFVVAAVSTSKYFARETQLTIVVLQGDIITTTHNFIFCNCILMLQQTVEERTLSYGLLVSQFSGACEKEKRHITPVGFHSGQLTTYRVQCRGVGRYSTLVRP